MITPMRERRFFAQMTIYDLAMKTGIDPGRISLIERGYKTPREEEKKKISDALGANVTDVFSGEAK